MVNPVTEPQATSRSVYLPKTEWYDFWTGKKVAGGQDITAIAPLDRLPLFVRAGSILPMGPEEEYARQKPADPIELRVYRGSDGDFVLYEDEGDSYDYEKGAYATIPMHWDDAKQTLTIGPRTGEYPGMLKSRTFQIVFVSDDHGAGISPAQTADKTVTFAGSSLQVTP
jgi:alpha-D-xyloside xylohydrolase